MNKHCLIFALLLSLFAGCNDGPATTEFSGTAMTVPYRIIIGRATTADEQQHIEMAIRTVFAHIDAVYNKWNPASELSLLNGNRSTEPFPLSPHLTAFLSDVDKIVSLTDGRFDPTIEAVQKVWKEHLERNSIPSQEALTTAHAATGWHNLVLNGDLLSKRHPDTAIDLGGIAKGFCVDRLVDTLNREGYGDLLVDWGGELKATGQHPTGRPWRVFISGLGNTHPDDAIAIVDLNNSSIATSGDYLQQWKISNTTYTHIYDPQQKKPLEVTEETIASASIVAPSCTDADAIATAATTFPTVEEGKLWLEDLRRKGVITAYWICSRDILQKAE